MNTFIKKSLLFIIPFLAWGIIVFVIDPFNYFNKSSLISNKAKINAENLNTLLFRTIDFVNYPSRNILIGDSRTDALPIDLIEKYTKQNFQKLNTNATKLNEIFDLFYFSNKIKKIETVVIGINFSMFNKFSYENRVNNVIKIIENPFLYVFNKDIFEACFYVLRSFLFNINLDSKPPISKEDFWQWTINVKSNHWYGRYKFPKELLQELIEFDEFTKKNNINVILINIPHHIDFHEKLISNNLKMEENKFKNILSSLNAKVYDFDYLNEITSDKINFKDPIHYNDSIGRLMVREIWGNNLKFGKKL